MAKEAALFKLLKGKGIPKEGVEECLKAFARRHPHSYLQRQKAKWDEKHPELPTSYERYPLIYRRKLINVITEMYFEQFLKVVTELTSVTFRKRPERSYNYSPAGSPEWEDYAFTESDY